MVKAYLRYELSNTWGVITSKSNICYDRHGKYLFTASLERVAVWDVKQAVLVRSLSPPLTSLASSTPPKETTALASSPSTNHIAAGYADGVVRVWNTETWDCESTFSGHKGAVTALRFSSTGALLASGSQDCSIVVWDVSGEAGLYRLTGHRGQVTDLVFLSSPPYQTGEDHTGPSSSLLASSSKDECVRVWELESQHCCQILAGVGGEVWSLDIDPIGRRLAVGTSDAELRIFAINTHHTQDQMDVLTPMGSVRRSAPERVATVRYYDTRAGTVLVCQGAGKVTDIWRVRSDAEARKRTKRRQRRRREKGRGAAAEEVKEGAKANNGGGKETVEATAVQLEAVDELQPNGVIRSKHKASSCTLVHSALPGGKGPSRRNTQNGLAQPIRLALALSNNSIEIWEVKQSSLSASKDGAGETAHQKEQGEGEGEGQEGEGTLVFQADKVSSIDGPGHRSDIRALALSSDDSLSISTSNSGVKVWNPRTGACLRTISEVGYGLSTVFAPGNKHAVVATKEGGLEVVDIAGAERIGSPIEAHDGPAWSVAALPDGSGLVSGGADHNVIFWEWNLHSRDANNKNGSDVELGVARTRTMTMTDDVLCVRVSPDGRLLAVALLDSTVRVFFVDSLKFFLSMYGHKLPVLSMDISSDGTLLATGSADKNLKIWGLDFGDCHRSLFAHSDSITAVAFVPKTHYIFTAGKDGLIKYWDADKFELLLELSGHQGQIWALAVSSLGDFLLTGSHDRSVRRWERTDEPFFIEEEKEKRLESLFEEDLVRDGSQTADGVGPGGKAEAGLVAGRKTLESVSAADAVIDALDLASAEEERREEFAKAVSGSNGGTVSKELPPNPLLLGLSPSEYVLKALMQVRSSELEQALLLVPFTDALRLLGYMGNWVEEGTGGTKVESLTRATALLLRVHLHQLSSTPSAKELLLKLQRMLRERVQKLKDTMGINLAAIGHLGRFIGERKRTPGLEDAAAIIKSKKAKSLV